MGKKWNWFFDVVTHEIEPVLAEYGYHPLPEPDHHTYTGHVAGALYRHNNRSMLEVKILERGRYKDGVKQGIYYWVAIDGRENPKYIVNPPNEPVTPENVYALLGWVFDEPQEFNTIVHYIVQTLNLYFTRST